MSLFYFILFFYLRVVDRYPALRYVPSQILSIVKKDAKEKQEFLKK